jgi:hypothetical protein
MSVHERRLWALIKERFAIRIDLIGKEDLIEMFRGKYIYSTIPCYSYSEERPSIDEQGSMQIESIEQGRNFVQFDLRKNRIQLSVTPEKLYIGDVVYLLYLLFTKILQEAGYFLVHGSSVACNHKAVLFVGPSESGKTMVSFALCLKHGFSLVSSDMSLLKREGNEILVVGGTRECSMYPGTMETVFGRTEMFPNSSRGPWDEKVDVNETQLQKLGVQYEENVPLSAIYYLRVQDSTFFVKSLDEVAAKIKALGLLSEWIRGANNLVVSTNSLVPSFDTKKAEKERLRALEVISTSVRQYSLYGNLEKVAEFIASQNK